VNYLKQINLLVPMPQLKPVKYLFVTSFVKLKKPVSLKRETG
jgi:hypothetical protein